MSEILKALCSVEAVKYYKNEFGIVVVSVDRIKEGTPRYDKQGQLVIKGEMPQPVEGNTYHLVAEYVNHPKWGDQYNVISFFSAIDFDETSDSGKKKFLASLFTPGQVENLYQALSDPYMVLKTNDARELIKVRGCGMDTAARWIVRFNEKVGMARIFTELESYNLTNNMIQRLISRYKAPESVIEKVKNNPYVLCQEVDGIGWKTADKIALEGGMDQFSVERIGAYIHYYLEGSGQNGCSWVTPDELMGAILEALGDEVPDERITEAIRSMEQLWWDDDKTKIGLKKYHSIEERIAKELIRLRDAETKIGYGNWEDAIKHIEHQNGWEFTDEQKNGVKTALENNVVVIHGLAGVGKSTLVQAFLEALRQYSFVQCALSGRAASRMSEITGKEGFTIHRLLGYPDKSEEAKNMFTYHDENPLWADIVIVDEISMVDAYLFYYLLRAIPSGSKLICLGDMGQLESIGCGNIAYDMIHSDEIPTVRLTKIHRQAAASAIITESIRLRQGDQIVQKDWAGQETRGELQDLLLDCYSDASNTFYKVMQAFSKAMARDNFDIMETQIIVPVKTKGDACTFNINNTVQELYNPSDGTKDEIGVFSHGKTIVFREGDKVLNTKNQYRLRPPIFNGNLGVIKRIYKYEDSMLVSFLGIGDVLLEKEHIKDIELGYCISCHKSQGSQFDHIIFGLDFSGYSLLTRELVYTGITRAKKKCDLIAQTGALRLATGREGVSKKQTHLQQCLYDTAHPKLVF